MCQGALITPPTKNEFNVDAYAKQEEKVAQQQKEAEWGPAKGGPDPFAAQRAYFEKLFQEGPDEGGSGGFGGSNDGPNDPFGGHPLNGPGPAIGY